MTKISEYANSHDSTKKALIDVSEDTSVAQDGSSYESKSMDKDAFVTEILDQAPSAFIELGGGKADDITSNITREGAVTIGEDTTPQFNARLNIFSRALRALRVFVPTDLASPDGTQVNVTEIDNRGRLDINPRGDTDPLVEVDAIKLGSSNTEGFWSKMKASAWRFVFGGQVLIRKNQASLGVSALEVHGETGNNIQEWYDSAGTLQALINSNGDFLPAPTAVGDGHATYFTRANTTTGVEPTGVEVASPIDGDSAILQLSDNTLEFWAYETNAWVLKITAVSSVSTPTEEDVLGNTIEDATWTGTENLDLDTFRAGYFTLTGNTTITVTNPPAAGESFVVNLTVKGTATESLTFPVSWTIIGTYSADTAENYITIHFQNYTTAGAKVVAFITNP